MVRVALVVGVGLVGFIVFQEVARTLETRAAVAMLRAFGSRRVVLATDTSILVVPVNHGPFQAMVTPTCSSLSSLLAIASLGAICPPGHRRRLIAVTIASLTIVAGNVLRIAGSVAVGILAGRTSLILFHDWVGSVFAFGYTLVGYVLLLRLLLHRPSTEITSPWTPATSKPSSAPQPVSP